MKRSALYTLIVGALVFWALVIPAVAYGAPPANDNFANATAILGLPFSETTPISEATLEAEEPISNSPYAGRSVWYSFAPTANAVVRTQGSGAAAFLVVYRADSAGFGGLVPIVGDHWSTPTGPVLQLQAGNTYYFQGGDRYAVWGYTDTFALNLTAIEPPPNDNFADAIDILELPFRASPDLTAATTESSEPTTTCGTNLTQSAWYKFTPTTSGGYGGGMWGTNVYTGTSLDNLTNVACSQTVGGLAFHAEVGTTYYLQVYGYGVDLDLLPPPNVEFYWNPGDPSIFDAVSFGKVYWEPTVESLTWDFGDGATATGPHTWPGPQHTYAADGDYAVTLTATTIDERTNSATQVVQVRTHDVSILWSSATSKSRVGRTIPIQVGIGNTRYPETVEVNFYKNTPSGLQWIGTVTKTVPKMAKNKTTMFSVNYTFTNDDLAVGKVNFQAVASIQGARDVYPGDNTATTSTTTVTR